MLLHVHIFIVMLLLCRTVSLMNVISVQGLEMLKKL